MYWQTLCAEIFICKEQFIKYEEDNHKMNTLKKFLSMKWIAILSVVIYGGSLIPIFSASIYAFPQADDWSYSWQTRLAWLDTHSLLEVLKGACTAVAEAYVEWQGTFSSIFLMSLQPGIWGEHFYAVVPFFMIGLLTFATLFFLSYVLKGTDRSCRIIFSMAVLWMTVQEIRCKPAAFYWYNGAVHYIVPYCLFLILAVLILKILRKEKFDGISFFFSLLIVVMIGGGNLVTALLTFVCLTGMFLLMLFIKRKKRLWCVAMLLATNVLAFGINILAPGNWLRQRLSGEPSNPVVSIFRSFYYGFFYIGEWTDETVLLMILLLIPIMVRMAGQIRFSFPFPGLIGGLSFCILSSMFTPSDYAVHTVNIGRVKNIIFAMYILLLMLNLFYLIGWYVKKMQRQNIMLKEKSFSVKEGICFYGVLAVLAFNILLTTVAEPQRFTSALAVKELYDGTAEEFGEAAWNNIQILKKDEDEAVIEEVPKDSLLLTSRDDIDQWHFGAKMYFRKDKVTVLKRKD